MSRTITMPFASALRAATSTAGSVRSASTFGSAARVFASAESRRTYADGSSSRARATTDTSAIDERILNGLDGFLPKSNVDRISEWQAGLWERLQAEVRNNPALQPVRQKWDRSGLDMIHLLTFSSRDPNLSLAFNYASLLLNNSFFLENLNPGEAQAPPAALPAHLGAKAEAYADGIVGSAWLWLAKTGPNSSDVDIIPTFGAGTLLVAGRTQRGREDVPAFLTPATSGSSGSTTAPASAAGKTESSGSAQPPLNEASAPGAAVRGGASASSQTSIYPFPLAVLSLHEHAYLGDKYGVWSRKQYARDWWKTLAWQNITVSQV